MNTSLKPLRLGAVLLSLTAAATGQPLNELVTFNGGNGANPQACLTASGSTLYGTTYAGGISNAGTVFTVNTSGGGFSNVYNFTGGNDGRGPLAALVCSG